MVTLTSQIKTDNELTRQKLDQLDEMMMDVNKDVRELAKKIESLNVTAWSREDHQRYSDATNELLRAMSKGVEANTQASAVIQSKLEDMEKRLKRVEEN